MIGIGTALADEPALTCRLPGLEDRSPVRIVADSRLRLPADSRLAKTANQVTTWVVTTAGSAEAKRKALEDKGVEVIEVLNGGSRGSENDEAGHLAEEYGYRGIGGSDAHIVSHIGRCATRFETPVESIEGLVAALKNARYQALEPA